MVAMRAGIYCRISRDVEDTQLGVDRQEADCRKLCQERGWTVVEPPYIDNDITAADPKKKRKEYARLLKDITNGRVNAVVVWDEDRLHRQPAELEGFVSVCDIAGMTTLASVGGDTDLSDEGALFMLRIKGAVAAQEIAKMRKRARRKMVELAERGEFKGGTRPFGYGVRPVDDSPEAKAEAQKHINEINEAEAVLIRQAVDHIIEGGTLYAIQQDWQGRVATTRGASNWSMTALRQMLTSPRIAGLRQHGREVIGKTDSGKPKYGRPIIVGEAVWPAIVDRDKWEQCVAFLTDPSRKQPKASRTYPLRGVLTCGNCAGHPYLEVVAAKQRAYGHPKTRGGCGVSINADRVEEYVYSLVLPLADDPALLDAIRTAEAGDQSEAAELVSANAADTAKLAELADMLGDGDLDRAVYLKQSKRLSDRINSRLSALVSLRGQSALDRLGGSVRSDWERMSADDRRMVTLAIIEDVRVARAARKGPFDPERLTIRYRFDVIAKIAKARVDGETHIGNGTVVIKPEWTVKLTV